MRVLKGLFVILMAVRINDLYILQGSTSLDSKVARSVEQSLVVQWVG